MESIWKCYPIEKFQNNSLKNVVNNRYKDAELDAILNSEIDKALGTHGELNYPYVEDFENTIDTEDKCKAHNDRNTWCANSFLNKKHNKQGCFAACTDPRFPMARGECNDFRRAGLQCGTSDKSIDIKLSRNKKFFTKRKRVPGSIGVDK
jgi:hypothetical protein